MPFKNKITYTSQLPQNTLVNILQRFPREVDHMVSNLETSDAADVSSLW